MKNYKVKRITILFFLVLIIICLCVGCNELNIFNNVGDQFEIKIIDIGFKRNTSLNAIFDSTAPRVVVPGNYLSVKVNVIPKPSFTGEPFNISSIRGTNIETSSPLVWLAVLSKDGYFFGATGPLTWTRSELVLPSESERNYYYAEALREQRIKGIVVKYIPSTDRDVVALTNDVSAYIDDIDRETWGWILEGDWLFGGNPPIDATQMENEIESMFYRYFTLRVVTKDQYMSYRAAPSPM